jgi:predicted nuclease with TOPRIM domain
MSKALERLQAENLRLQQRVTELELLLSSLHEGIRKRLDEVDGLLAAARTKPPLLVDQMFPPDANRRVSNG